MPNNIKWPLMKNNISRSDLNALINHLQKDDPKLTHGPAVKSFENAWSNWLGVKYSVMVNSGASANDLTMIALRELHGLGEVIVPGLTWVSDIASVINSGHTPIFVDIDKETLAMDINLVLKAISPKTKAVFLTHILGFNGLTDKLLAELEDRGILLIEDVCESHGATHNDKKIGTFGWASNFSFYYAHHMTTIEGGMISTDDFELYELARMLRSHGMVRESSSELTKEKYKKRYPELNPDFIFAVASHNMRPTELGGILGMSQLPRLNDAVLKRKSNFDKFISLLDKTVFQAKFSVDGNSNYAFTLILNKPNFELRNKVEFSLSINGIEFRRGLSGGGNQLRQPYLKGRIGLPAPESLVNVDHVHHFGWYIGNYPDLDAEFFDDLARALNEIREVL